MKPEFDFFGDKISEKIMFFKLPINIGEIIAAYSSLKDNDKPLTREKIISNKIKIFTPTAIICIFVVLILKQDLLWMFICLSILVIVALMIEGEFNIFFHKSFFVGTKGFAQFEISDFKKNITKQIEINFEEVSDLFVEQTDVHDSSDYYRETLYKYVFLKKERDYITLDPSFKSAKKLTNLKRTEVFLNEGNYDKEDKIKDLTEELIFCRKIEKYWTKYLIDSIDGKLKKDGYLLFRLYFGFYTDDFIKLGVDGITFMKTSLFNSSYEEFTYSYKDIKQLYIKNNFLYIEHSNFERKFYFIKSGNSDQINLMLLCNRSFFFKALQRLSGFKFD